MKHISILKQALPYIRRHKGRTMVIKLGGELAAQDDALRSLAQDLSLVVHVGIRACIVHGGGPQATEMSKRLGLQPVMVEGRRVTDRETLDVAKMVFAGQVNLDILSALRAQGVAAVGLSGVDGDVIHAVRRSPVEVRDSESGRVSMVDYGHVGDVVDVQPRLLSLLMDNGYVPVISSLASDEEGNVLNINADTVSSVLARALGAYKLISLTTVPGVLVDANDPATLIPYLSPVQAREAVASGVVRGGMKPKVMSLVEAVEGGVERAHILSGLDEGAMLLELFTRDGCGTLIATEAHAPRPAEVTPPGGKVDARAARKRERKQTEGGVA
ncbi:MAG: acetylglutamate kinase [Planctomycetes bacterium]|nr:acetylglutamate kinase [Planctomycetota bacterium]